MIGDFEQSQPAAPRPNAAQLAGQIAHQLTAGLPAPRWRSAAEIALQLGCSKRNVTRIAQRDGWPCRRRASRFEYLMLEDQIALAAHGPIQLSNVAQNGTRHLVALPAEPLLILRALRRAITLLHFVELREASFNASDEALITQTVRDLQHVFAISKSSAFRWLRAWRKDGFCALFDRGLGRPRKTA